MAHLCGAPTGKRGLGAPCKKPVPKEGSHCHSHSEKRGPAVERRGRSKIRSKLRSRSRSRRHTSPEEQGIDSRVVLAGFLVLVGLALLMLPWKMNESDTFSVPHSSLPLSAVLSVGEICTDGKSQVCIQSRVVLSLWKRYSDQKGTKRQLLGELTQLLSGQSPSWIVFAYREFRARLRMELGLTVDAIDDLIRASEEDISRIDASRVSEMITNVYMMMNEPEEAALMAKYASDLDSVVAPPWIGSLLSERLPRNPYQILQLEETASQEEIRWKSYELLRDGGPLDIHQYGHLNKDFLIRKRERVEEALETLSNQD